ncbi:Uma2 family endonuclease [Jiella sonneratiae]|uniref:Uma2 family endonuclease n=1 Tax=Jiella sonneratiae TaxID=2816856 RepID=A0ABS3J503_9HYPH|nr:Uma2 family endonuclease [Jiella sonneratiae]MBO0904162.1 Uma2 family endonuclease [Jiella sonneratiae]
MSGARQTHWTVEEFLVWQEGRPGRYEFVGGEPVKMMTGATARHDEIVLNVLAELRQRLRGNPCRPFTADLCVKTIDDRIRRPDAGVDCGHRAPTDLVAKKPVLVVEVFSPSTRDLDRAIKLTEYKAVPSIRTIFYVEPNRPEVYVFERTDDDGWSEGRRVVGLENDVAIPALGISLPLAEIYDGITFVPGPLLG